MKRPPAMLTAPWLISEAGAALVWAVYQRDWDGETIARARADRPAPYANPGGSYAVDGDVAIVSVTGPIMRHGGMLADVSGATSDEQIRGALAAAAADPRITSVVLNLDSPGGEASGASDTADAIRALDAVKPVVAYVGGMAASKGYWFASAARQIVASRDAHLGSIGVRISLVDESAADQQAGTKRIEIVSGVGWPARKSFHCACSDWPQTATMWPMVTL